MSDEAAREAALSAAIERCQAIQKKAIATCDHNAIFEARARLYDRRFRRLAPGKDDRMHDSGSPANRALFEAWTETGLADLDALVEVVRLTEALETALRRLEDQP